MDVPPYVARVCSVLQDNGWQAYVVGGGVRDALLGRKPTDWDVATDARPEHVQKVFPWTVATGIRFGTVTVLLRSDGDGGEAPRTVEVTTFRGEGEYKDGRRPEKVYYLGRIEGDLERRDFTVNAMAYDPAGDVLVDPFGGRTDLRLRRLRAVGDPDARFEEDGLRVMRAVRLATELQFVVEPKTGQALRRHGDKLLRVSRERVGEEWRRLLLSDAPGRGLFLLAEYELLHYVLPFNEGENAFSSAVVAATVKALERVSSKHLAVRTAVAAYGLGDGEARRLWLRRLVYPKRIARDVMAVADGLDAFFAEEPRDDSGLRRFLAGLGKERLSLFVAALTAWAPEAAARWRPRIEAIVQAGDPLHPRELAMDGRDVQRAIGIEAGPEVGYWMARLFDHVLDHPEDNKPQRLRRQLASWMQGGTDASAPSAPPTG